MDLFYHAYVVFNFTVKGIRFSHLNLIDKKKTTTKWLIVSYCNNLLINIEFMLNRYIQKILDNGDFYDSWEHLLKNRLQKIELKGLKANSHGTIIPWVVSRSELIIEARKREQEKGLTKGVHINERTTRSLVHLVSKVSYGGGPRRIHHRTCLWSQSNGPIGLP